MWIIMKDNLQVYAILELFKFSECLLLNPVTKSLFRGFWKVKDCDISLSTTCPGLICGCITLILQYYFTKVDLLGTLF